MSLTLLSSPLQGFTDYRFRNAFHKHFGGIDTFYAPYIRLNGKLDVKSSYRTDLLPENNDTLTVIPQIITNSAEEFVFVAKYVQDLGYKELNWNLGCPYPMVTKKGMGSGLIASPEKIDEVLERAHQETDILVSMKMRMGYLDAGEILDTFPILEKYPIKNVAIHARIGKQVYKGGVDLKGFQNCIDGTKLKLYYNGDITNVDVFKSRQERFPDIDHWMIGRGLIADPFLPSMIKNNTTEYPEDRFEIFKAFHDEIYAHYKEDLPGPTPLRMKMLSFWTYFSQSFPDPQKTFKKIKKAKDVVALRQATNEILNKAKRLKVNQMS